MDSKSILERSIYFKDGRLLGLPIELIGNKVILDSKFTIDITYDCDLLISIFESGIRQDRGMLFNVRQWLFNLAKANRPDITLERMTNNSCLLCLSTSDNKKVCIKDSRQFLEFINMR